MKLKILRSAQERIRAFTMLCPDEISGLGKLEVDADQNFVVTQVEIFDQEVSGTHSTIEAVALAKFQTERVTAGESMKQWTLWWHSHADMGVFFSSTDTNTINSSREFPYLVSLVVNKAGESEARLDVFNPVHIFMPLEVEVIEDISVDVKELCQKEIDEKVKRPVRKYSAGYSPYGRDDEREFERYYKPSRTTGFQRGMEDSLTKYERSEYFGHKGYLMAAIWKLEKSVKPKHRRRLEALKKAMEEHIVWGKTAGFEVTRDEEDDTSDRQPSLIPENIPRRD